ncbi:MAG: hypothetical protein LBU15_02145, partial [Rickettsiales bacterium]|nr:hypothetical protein [Rickettsiales bacterium]
VRQRGKLQRALKFVLGGLQNFFGLVKRLAQSIFSNKLRRTGDEMDSGFPGKDKGSKEPL